ncbi:MAG TPA: nucleoside monophosphate kinase [Candidatus Bathyarchaeia archaeon]|nr:nucleoside monophosphate kinase [Candidatus Bathyarchaeia archaeon]
MKDLHFPIFKSKSRPGSPRFDLSDARERQKYFQFKAGEEIGKLKKYLKDNTFIALLIGKKSSGKGTYTKLFGEAVGPERIAHVSVGDVVRSLDKDVRDPKRRKKLEEFLKTNYRGWLPIDQIITAQLKRSTKTLMPTEFVLALLKREIAKQGRKAIFLDGFPRDMDQVSYSLFFRDLIDFRDDPDLFVLFDVPLSVIDERIKHRVICPQCQTPRNLKLLATKKAGFDPETGKFFLYCDNPKCKDIRMVRKEGDELGIGPIKKRLDLDDKLIRQAFSLYGVPKVLLRNAVPVEKAKEAIDDYELTPAYFYQVDQKDKKVKIKQKPWVIPDDEGVSSHSLLAPAVTLSMIVQIAEALDL